MVLYSRQTATPLFALTSKAEDSRCLNMLTARPSSNAPVPFFQGMLNLPDQHFSFVLSNLSEKSMICLDILHLPNPQIPLEKDQDALFRKTLQRVNKVNCLNANQPYEVAADKSTGNRKMILSGKTKIVLDPMTGVEEEVAVKVDEAEKKDDGPTGIYFYLSLWPEKSTSTTAKFAEGTAWKVVPGFVRKVAKSVVHKPIAHSYSSDEKEEDCCEPPSANVFSSQTGKLTHGSVVQERTRSVFREFDCDHCSEPTVLSMSILEDMKLLPLKNDSIKQELELEVDDLIKNEQKALLESLNGGVLYQSHTCVIDLESEADTIICSCGHQCIHHSNVTTELVRCPMCRAPITAFVRTKDNFGYVGAAPAYSVAPEHHDGGRSTNIFEYDELGDY